MFRQLTKKIKVFYCYAHTDQDFRNELEQHLSHLKRLYHLETWFDHQISPGDVWEKSVSTYLKGADLIFLFICPDFTTFNFCYQGEMQYVLERHLRGEIKVVP